MARAAPPKIAARIVVTIAVVLLVVLGERVHAPGLYRGALDDELWPGVFSIGLSPVLSAYFLVELVALVVPRLRPLRHGGPAGRAKLDFFVGILATALGVVQAFGVASYLPTIDPRRTVFLPNVGLPLFVASLVAGIFVLWIAARACNRYGLVNGYVLIVLASVAPAAVAQTGRALTTQTVDSTAGWLLVSAILLSAIASFVVLAFVGPIRRPRLVDVESYRISPPEPPPQHPWIPVPVSSLQPYIIAGATLAMPALLANLGIGGMRGLSTYFSSPAGQLAAMAFVTLAVTYVFGVAFFGPSRVTRDLERVQPDPPKALRTSPTKSCGARWSRRSSSWRPSPRRLGRRRGRPFASRSERVSRRRARCRRSGARSSLCSSRSCSTRSRR
jgi:preprotein translocase subunit SecY